jgi:hypothetical protein
MKTTVVLFLCLAIISGSAVWADDVAVTVYNSNLGVISETRNLDFQKGINRLAFRDVPSQIDPNSVRFDLAGGDGVTILEQNYAFDLVSPDQIYKKYIDKKIELVDKDANLYAGTLLAVGGGAVTLQSDNGQIRIIAMDKVVESRFPELPEGLITKPTLFWLYSSDITGERTAKVGYQTTGMSWNAEYVGVLDQGDKHIDLSGWAAINNTSGKAYADATLKLVAGDINRAIQLRGGRGPQMEMFAAKADMAESFEQKSFFEYHLYTLPRKATLANNEIKQISLFDPAGSTIEKVYVFRPEQNAGQVSVAIKFKNSESTGLGMPLPAGRVRLFKADDDGSLIMLGEDMINHTPKDEEVKLTIGNAFDIVPEETMTGSTRVSQNVEDRTFELQMRNRKKEAVTVTVEKQFYSFWEVTNADFTHKKKDAQTLTFDLAVPADSAVTVRYTVRLTNR